MKIASDMSPHKSFRRPNRPRGVASILWRTFVLCGLLSACHHAPLKNDAASQQSETARGELADVPKPAENLKSAEGSAISGPVPTLEKILSSYSLLQLDAAANAYKTAASETIGKNGNEATTALFGCPVAYAKAKGAASALASVLEAKIEREQASYVRTPSVYIRTRDAAVCERTCSCGALSDVLSGVDVRVLKKTDRIRHENLLLELQGKSAKQGLDATFECAKKQNWICGSELERYANAHAGSTPSGVSDANQRSGL